MKGQSIRSRRYKKRSLSWFFYVIDEDIDESEEVSESDKRKHEGNEAELERREKETKREIKEVLHKLHDGQWCIINVTQMWRQRQHEIKSLRD